MKNSYSLVSILNFRLIKIILSYALYIKLIVCELIFAKGNLNLNFQNISGVPRNGLINSFPIFRRYLSSAAPGDTFIRYIKVTSNLNTVKKVTHAVAISLSALTSVTALVSRHHLILVASFPHAIAINLQEPIEG